MKFVTLDSNLCCKDIIQNIYNLNDLDILVYNNLKKSKESRVNSIAKKLKKERSTIYRSLQKLTSSKLCIKKTKTIKSGGYYHTYFCNDINIVRREIEGCIDNWYLMIKKTLKRLDDEL